jgi:hypothetical protein
MRFSLDTQYSVEEKITTKISAVNAVVADLSATFSEFQKVCLRIRDKGTMENEERESPRSMCGLASRSFCVHPSAMTSICLTFTDQEYDQFRPHVDILSEVKKEVEKCIKIRSELL